MKRLVFWFDPISPFAYLAFHRLPEVLQGRSYAVEYRPVLLAGLLGHWQTKGPAEVVPKRAWTYRHVSWLAQHHGLPMRLPDPHPFNPLPLLRMALACVPAGECPNRRIAGAVIDHAFRTGGDVVDPARLAELATAQGVVRDPAGEEVKRELRTHTDAAIAAGVFGVPTITCEGRLFWGLDALPMLADFIDGGRWFDGPAWAEAEDRAPGVARR